MCIITNKNDEMEKRLERAREEAKR